MRRSDVQAVLSDLDRVAAAHHTELLLVGAWARDALLRAAGAPDGLARATSDVDLCICVQDWSAYDAFVEACAADFDLGRRKDHRLRHRSTQLPVDLVAAGGVAEPQGHVAVRGSDRRWNVLGVEECFSRGSFVDGLHRVRVPPVEGFLLLKLLAYGDRAELRDVEDFHLVLRRCCTDVGMLWDDEAFLNGMERRGWVYEDFPAWWLGRQWARWSPAIVAAAVQSTQGLASAPLAVRVKLSDSRDGPEPLEAVERRLALLLEALRR